MAFNKAAVSRKVRKSSKQADEFAKANEKIEKVFEQVEFSGQAKENGIKFEIEDEKFIQDIEKYISSTKINYAVTLLRSFIGMQGTVPGVEKAKRLVKRFRNAFAKDRIDDKNRLYDEVMKAITELDEYIKDPEERVEIEVYGLSAPRGICTKRIKCKGLRDNGQLKSGYKFLKGGAVVRVKKKVKAEEEKRKAKGLKAPEIKLEDQPSPTVNTTENELVQHSTPTVATVKPPVKKWHDNARAKNLATAMQEKSYNPVFDVPGAIGQFLGKVEKKPVHSVVTTLDAEQGSGKTRFFFQVMDVLSGMGMKVLFYSLEEHPASKLFKDKVNQYIAPENLENISVIDEVDGWDKERAVIQAHDAIFIDSFQKLPDIDLDSDIRKAFNGKWFFVIYQQTGTKTMRGGSKAAFDGDQILKIEKDEDYRKNKVYTNKNRYNDAPNLKYNIYSGALEGETPQMEVTQNSSTKIERTDSKVQEKLIAIPFI